MKKKIATITVCTALSTFFVILLFVVSNKVKQTENGFIRLFPPHIVDSQSILDIKLNSYYISGLSSEHIYLGNLTAPIAFESSMDLDDTQTVDLKVPSIQTTSPESFRLKIDSANAWLIDRLSTSLYFGKIYDSCKLIGKLDSTQFIEALPISSSSFIIRKYDNAHQQTVLVKKGLRINNPTPTHLLEKHLEGMFSTDGSLVYDRYNSNLIYVYRYRHLITVLDTNLNVVDRGKTIDTTTVPRLSVSEIESKKVKTLSSPPFVVNKKASVNKNYLFVNSGLHASNERKEIFDERSVIDVYDLKGMKYKLSFYIPQYNKNTFSDFCITDNNKLVAIYDHYLITYHLNIN